MPTSFFVSRQAKIGDVAALVGTTPRAIRHYHDMGLISEPGRGSDGRRRYGFQDVVRLLWIRKMAEAGITLDDIRDAFTDTATAAETGESEGGGIEATLARLEEDLAARAAELARQQARVQRMRAEGSRMGLLSEAVTGRLKNLPEGSLRQDDLDTLLVTERIFGPLGAAVQASRFMALAAHPELRVESDRVDAAEEALDDTVAVDDPRVAETAARRHAFEKTLMTVIEESGIEEEEAALLGALDAAHPEAAEDTAATEAEEGGMSVFEAATRLPHGFSPARVRCAELAQELADRD
ncbi:MerR family transcriptional regulator [Streptomyces sp. BE303]|uniref:MerR family transcriptional regulator n=1 Tax=Streptomyces sp. BE303 TaxID=3002528 RepID=UPI002E7A2A45|nr:MerR family transcriptional regulator [Streptomyces sp. BE303]MED7954022.1 MerR family transcriptional regulator [Streptomyces sp. BE303]